MSKLEEKILEKGQKEVESILASAKLEAETLYESLIKKAELDLMSQKEKAIKKFEANVLRTKVDSQREIRDEVALAKQKLISSIFSELSQYLSNISKEDFFKYVKHSILNETISGDETIALAKHDYQKYASTLSSKSGNLVEADLLNQALGKNYHLKLTQSDMAVDSGFLLMGKDFDLNFSFKETLDKLAAKYEKTIYEELV